MSKMIRASVFLLATVSVQAVILNKGAPNFTLWNSFHQKRTLRDLKGNVVLINFWASWCGPCQQEFPLLRQLATEYKGKKVKVLAVNVDRDRDSADTFLSKLGSSPSPLEVLWDQKSKVVGAYDIDGMPTSFILDEGGVIRFVHQGFHPQDPLLWRKEIDGLLAARTY